MTEEIQLLPCPFCGGEAELIQDFNHPSRPAAIAWQVDCVECWIETLYHNTPEEAAAFWNTRHVTPFAPVDPIEAFAQLKEKFGDSFDEPAQPSSYTAIAGGHTSVLSTIGGG